MLISLFTILQEKTNLLSTISYWHRLLTNLRSSRVVHITDCWLCRWFFANHWQILDQYLKQPCIQVSINFIKVSKGAKIRSRYNQVPHPTQDTNGKVTNSQLDTTNESQEVSPFPAGDHKAHINRRAQRHSKHKTEQKHKSHDVK